MFATTFDHGDDIVKVGFITPLHKKKEANDTPDHFRGVCLLPMISRLLARVMATRLRDWSEEFGALYDNQNGFDRTDLQQTRPKY